MLKEIVFTLKGKDYLEQRLLLSFKVKVLCDAYVTSLTVLASFM